MGKRSVGIETLVLGLIDRVHAIRENLLLYVLEVVAGHYGFELHTELVGKLPAFGQKLKAHIGHLTVFEFAINYEVVLICHCSEVFMIGISRWYGWL